MIYREDKKANDLFYTCALIDYIGRQTKNTRTDVVNALGKSNIKKIYDLADIYHSDNIAKVSDDFITQCKIAMGQFDNVGACVYNLPTYWDIGKVYKRLIIGVAQEKNMDMVEALFVVYNSFISPLIDNYNGSMYYEYSKNLVAMFMAGKVEI